MSQPLPSATARLVVLGASNCTRGFPTIVHTVHRLLGTPIELLAAIGHGRSYGMRSRVLGRALPSIIECGLWPALRRSASQAPSRPTFALITDVGNDIMYNATPAVIEQWVETCVEQLRAADEAEHRITICLPPIERLRALSRRKYTIIRSILFPTRRLSYEQAMGYAEELHGRLIDLADRCSISHLNPPRDWYGVDPIHIRRSAMRTAWHAILSSVVADWPGCSPNVHRSPLDRLRLRAATPERWSLIGVPLARTQPCSVLKDGSTIALY